MAAHVGHVRPSTLTRLSYYDNLGIVIRSFGNRLAEDVYDNRRPVALKRLPPALYSVARWKLLYLHDAGDLRDLRAVPGSRLEARKGDRKGWFSIRVNDQWRVVFRWSKGDALDVSMVDYH